jgi:hypothetical protein
MNIAPVRIVLPKKPHQFALAQVQLIDGAHIVTISDIARCKASANCGLESPSTPSLPGRTAIRR